MNRLQSAALNASILAFSRARRRRDGDVIRDLALDMIEDGKSVRQQAINLALAGISDRFRALGSSPTSSFVRRGLYLLAALLAPVIFVAVSASFAATFFFADQVPDNVLASGFSFSTYWLVHAGLPWAMCLIGALLACVGFSRGNRSIARIGSIAVLIGSWLVVGTMGGWFSGEGFVGPAEIPFGSSGGDFVGSIYVIAPIAVISLLLAIGSMVMPRENALPELNISTRKAVVPGILAVPLVALTSLLGYDSAGFVFASITGFLIALPIYAVGLRRRESTREYASFIAGVVLVFLTVPSLLLTDQMFSSLQSFDPILAPQVFFGLIALAILAGATVALRSVIAVRKRT